MKSLAARAEVGSHDDPLNSIEMRPDEACDVRIEDLGDGTAQVSLRLPWPMVLQVLDFASAGRSAQASKLT
jgi:hypothetical protein